MLLYTLGDVSQSPPVKISLMMVQPRREPIFLVKRTGTITAKELAEEMKAEPADVEDDFLEMVGVSTDVMHL